MQYSALLYTLRFLATIFAQKLKVESITPENEIIIQHEIHSGCILPIQPIGGSFILYSCTGSSCNILPWTRVPHGSILKYNCNEGYVLKGGDISVCDSKGHWFLAPTCIRIAYCPALRSKSVNFDCKLEGKIVSCESEILPFTKATLACKSFYQFPFIDDPDSREITCLENGSWNRTDFNCDPECGIHESEINPGQFPWHVYIYKSISPRSPATLISPNLVISQNVNPNDYVVIAGKYHFYTNSLESHSQKSPVSRIFIAKGYEDGQAYYANNIALLYLQVPFEITTFVRPICLDIDSNDRIEEELSEGERAGKVVGWYQFLSPNTGNESYLTTVSYFSHEECSLRVVKDYKPYVTNDTFCTERPKDSVGVRSYTDVGMIAAGYETNGFWYLLGLFKSPLESVNNQQQWAYVFYKLNAHLDWIRATYGRL